MADIIYALYFIEDEQDNIFYVGRTNKPDRRLPEHLNDKTNSKKSRFIQYLLKSGIDIQMKCLGEVAAGFDEDIAMSNIEGEGHILVNSKAGDYSKPIQAVLEVVTQAELMKAFFNVNPLKKEQKYLKIHGFTIIQMTKKLTHWEIRINGRVETLQCHPLFSRTKVMGMLADKCNTMMTDGGSEKS